MESARILVAANNEALIAKLRATLTENGFLVIDHAVDGYDCLRKLRSFRPDIAVLDYELPSMNGYEVSKVAIEDAVCDIVLMVNDMQKNLVEDVKSEYGCVCLVKPLSKAGLISTIDLMLKNKKKVRELENEIEKLRASLDTRKEVEKAKGLLMKHLNLSEEEAFKRIQKQSMDRGISMKEVAKAINLAYSI